MMGKYLNGYQVSRSVAGAAHKYIPPGWDTWAVAGNGYPEYDYRLNEDHRVVSYGHGPDDYLTTVIGGLGSRFITSSVADRKPFFLELATFAPHAPSTPERSDAGSFAGLRAPRGPAFDRVPTHAPSWLAGRAALDRRELARIDGDYVKRVEAMQSVDRMIASVEATLRRTGQFANTVFVFSSDNGFHMGEHGLGEGKLTAFDTDVRVPLVVAGPGIAAGSGDSAVVENIDLAPTFESLGGARVPTTVDGRSIVALLHGASPQWRTIAAVEHHALRPVPVGDPDKQNSVSGDPPTHQAIRTANYLYVRYVDGDREYYDLRRDPDQLHNLAGQLDPRLRVTLDHKLAALVTCRGGQGCWAAGAPQAG